MVPCAYDGYLYLAAVSFYVLNYLHMIYMEFKHTELSEVIVAHGYQTSSLVSHQIYFLILVSRLCLSFIKIMCTCTRGKQGCIMFKK